MATPTQEQLDQASLRAALAECQALANGITAAEAQARALRLELQAADRVRAALVEELRGRYEIDDKGIHWDRPRAAADGGAP